MAKFLVGALLVMGASVACIPKHYSVAAAVGPTHATFAQRHHLAESNDYLVDCKLNAGGQVEVDAEGNATGCTIVELKGEF